MMSTSQNIIVMGSDTDMCVYGLASLEFGRINDKVVYIEKSIGVEYAHLNGFSEAVSTHPKLNSMLHPLLTLVAICILTGSDYISTFFSIQLSKFSSRLLWKMFVIYVQIMFFFCRGRTVFSIWNRQVLVKRKII